MSTTSSAHRIDVHQHVVPPFYAEALASHGGDPSGSVTPAWSPESTLDFMDSQQIATGILSVSTPSVVGWAQGERRQMARRVNEYTADLVAGRPGRFGSFATLPLPDIDGAVEELGYALDTLHADGVVLMASYAGKYLGDPAFEHPGDTPGQPPFPPAAGVAPPMTDFPFQTTRTGVQLVLNGILDRYSGARVILSHAGGFLPYASLRFAELARVFQPDAPSPDAILASLRRFYFDTALSSGPALPTLNRFASPGHILFGTDSPYDHGVSAAFTAALDADDSLTADDQAAISHRNAQALFPRLASQSVTATRRRKQLTGIQQRGTLMATARTEGSLRITPMLPEHADQVLAIYQAGIDEGDATFETTPPTWETFDAEKLPEHRLVALDDTGGRVLGWVAVARASGRPAYAGVVEHSVYVRPAARGQGVGLALLTALIASTEAAGIWSLRSGIFPENTASLAVHQRAGFRIVGTRDRPGRLHGRWRDVVLVERRSPTIT